MNHQSIKVLRKLGVTMLALVVVPITLFAQQVTITPNYKEADIRQIVEAVSAVTDRNFIIDPRVNAKVTMLSKTPMTPDAFYEAFLAILEVHQLAAMQSGDIIKIIPNATARQYGSPMGTGRAAGDDDIVTQVIQVQNVGAAQLVPILRPLIPQFGHLAAHPGSNMLIISDRAGNVARMVSIIRRIDLSSEDDIEVIPLQHASSSEVVRVLTALTQQPRSDGAPVSTSLVADARTNSVLVGGDRADRLRLRTLIAHLDTPLEDGGDTQVRYLRYADAEELATKLQQHFQGQVAAQGAAGGAAASPQNGDVSVWADTQTNAIVVNAPPKMMRSHRRKRAAEDDALPDADRRQARYPPGAGAGRSDHRRGYREQDRGTRHNVGSRRCSLDDTYQRDQFPEPGSRGRAACRRRSRWGRDASGPVLPDWRRYHLWRGPPQRHRRKFCRYSARARG
jgi:general secretion pathway protein D